MSKLDRIRLIREVCTAANSLHRELLQSPADWLPIATAPRDGTRVILFGNWNQAHGVLPQEPERKDVVWIGQFSTGLWQTGNFSIGYPTHWMPLPEAPY